MYSRLFEYVNKKSTPSNSDLMENLHCQVFMTVKIHIVVFWAMRPCSLVCGYQIFGGISAFRVEAVSVIRVEEMLLFVRKS